jgi:hypothetical protein
VKPPSCSSYIAAMPLLVQLTTAVAAHLSNVFLHKLAANDADEACISAIGDCARQQRLASACKGVDGRKPHTRKHGGSSTLKSSMCKRAACVQTTSTHHTVEQLLTNIKVRNRSSKQSNITQRWHSRYIYSNQCKQPAAQYFKQGTACPCCCPAASFSMCVNQHSCLYTACCNHQCVQQSAAAAVLQVCSAPGGP